MLSIRKPGTALLGPLQRCNRGIGQGWFSSEPPLRIYLQAHEVVGGTQFLSVCWMEGLHFLLGVSGKLPSVPCFLPQSLQGDSLLAGRVIILYNVIREVTSHNLSSILWVKNMSWSHPLKGRGWHKAWIPGGGGHGATLESASHNKVRGVGRWFNIMRAIISSMDVFLNGVENH